jgi:hypothetical protein
MKNQFTFFCNSYSVFSDNLKKNSTCFFPVVRHSPGNFFFFFRNMDSFLTEHMQ